MGRPTKPYSRLDREVVLNHLADVLSVDQQEASDLIEKHADEVSALARVLLGAGTDNGRHWSSNVLAKLPRNLCEIERYGCVISKGANAGRSSLKFLSSVANVVESDNSPEIHAETYRALHRGLCAEYVRQTNCANDDLGFSMMSWCDFHNSKNENLQKRLWSSDTNFGRALLFFENQLEEVTKRRRLEWMQFSKGEPSFDQDLNFYKLSLDDLMAVFDGVINDFDLRNIDVSAMTASDDWSVVEVAKRIDRVKDSLLLKVDVNLSVNRALNEMDAQNEIHLSAFEMLDPFLSALNSLGVDDLSRHSIDISFEEGEGLIREILLEWFSPGGQLIQAHPYFNKALFVSDIELILKWTIPLRDEYVSGRGYLEFGVPLDSVGYLEAAFKPEFSMFHRFLLALVMVAAYYGEVKIDNEIVGVRNRKKSVFPARGSVKGSPSVHVEEIVHAAFGQMYYSNVGFGIKHDRLVDCYYCRRKIRDLKMLMLWKCVKGRSVREVVSIFYFVSTLLLLVDEDAFGAAS